MPNIDHDKVSKIIQDVAAEKIMPRFRQLSEGEVRAKTGPTDLVTIADEEAEIELTRILTDYLPASVVLGEEAVSSGDVMRDVLQDKSTPVWIVDPVDGTHNFAHGKEIFGTMVALVQGGERVASWIYQIPKERMVSAQKGGGVQIDGASFKKPKKPDMPMGEMNAFISRKFIGPEMRPYVESKVSLIKSADTYFCCAWEYVEILEGAASFSIYKRIEPWDHMAGVLMLEESGFHVRKWDGSLYGGADLKGGLINAPTEALWNQIYDIFLKEPLNKFGF